MISARSEWAPDFSIYNLNSIDEVLGADPDDYSDDVEHYVWAWMDKGEGTIRSRMFASHLGDPRGRGHRGRGGAHHRLPQQGPGDHAGQGLADPHAWDPEGWVKVAGRVVDDGTRQIA